MQSCPLLSPGDSLDDLSYWFQDAPEAVLFTICPLGSQEKLFEPRPAEKIDLRGFCFSAVIPPDLAPGLYLLSVWGKGPGEKMCYAELPIAVQPKMEKQDFEQKGISIKISSQVDPNFTWE
jgi:hypothetical protein